MSTRSGVLEMRLLDVYQERVSDFVDVILQHQVLSDQRIVRRVDASKRIRISDLYAIPQGLYRLELDPLGYLPVSQYVNIAASGTTSVDMTCPVNPSKITSIDFPKFQDLPELSRSLLLASESVLGYEGKKGEELFSSLDDIRKAGLLNILAKCAQTRLNTGGLVVDSIRQLRELRGDRFFAVVSKQLREDTKNSVGSHNFFAVPEGVHHPPVGFDHAGSFKTFDRYGNLQLTFFTDGTSWVADIDIDDANGLEHVFQVVRNVIEQRPTNPFDIHEILVHHQKIDPGYKVHV